MSVVWRRRARLLKPWKEYDIGYEFLLEIVNPRHVGRSNLLSFVNQDGDMVSKAWAFEYREGEWFEWVQ